MRILSGVAVAVLASLAPAWASVVDVLSGDVIKIDEHVWRIANIDAPMLSSPCPDERRVAQLAQVKLAQIVGQGEMEIRPTGERDSEARAMALVSINGTDVGEQMLAARLAQRHGQARPLCVAHKPDSSWRAGIGPQRPQPAAPYPNYGIRGGAGQRR